MPDLPVEIWLDIASRIHFKRKELLRFIFVNRLFYDIFIQKLYANVHILLPSPENLSKSSTPSAGQAVLDKLKSDTQLRKYIQECQVEGPASYIRYDTEEFIASVMTLIGDLPNLKTIRLSNLLLHVRWIIYMASRPLLHLTIHTSRCNTYGSADPSGPYTAIELSQLHDEYHYYIAFGGSLQCLRLPDYPVDSLLSYYVSFGSPVLASLRHLEIYKFQPNIITLLRNVPALMTLQFNDSSPPSNINLDDWKDIVPGLESFSGHKKLIPLFVVGRPITSIQIWDFRGSPSLQSLGEDFGSIAPIHTVTLGCLGNVYDKVDYVTTKCSQIRELTIKTIYRMPLTRVSSSIQTEIDSYHIQDEVAGFLRKISNLKVLRRLAFLPIEDVDGRDEWEKESCEALRAKGCKAIVQVNFGEQSWTHHPDDSSWKKTVVE